MQGIDDFNNKYRDYNIHIAYAVSDSRGKYIGQFSPAELEKMLETRALEDGYLLHDVYNTEAIKMLNAALLKAKAFLPPEKKPFFQNTAIWQNVSSEKLKEFAETFFENHTENPRKYAITKRGISKDFKNTFGVKITGKELAYTTKALAEKCLEKAQSGSEEAMPWRLKASNAFQQSAWEHFQLIEHNKILVCKNKTIHALLDRLNECISGI